MSQENLNDYIEEYISEEVQKVRQNPRSITPLHLPRWTTTTASSRLENFRKSGILLLIEFPRNHAI